MTKEKEKQIKQTQKDLAALVSPTGGTGKAFIMPHDRIQIGQSAIELLQEYLERG